MNKKLHTTEIIGSYGILVSTSESTQSSIYLNGEYVDVVKQQTSLMLDTSTVQNQIQTYMSGLGRSAMQNEIHSYLVGLGQSTLHQEISKALKEKVRFGIVSWPNEDGTPVFTCQIYFNDKLIAEKTVEKDDEKISI